jgi:hypothetical protein
MKKVVLLMIFMGLASLTLGERVWAYSSLFDATVQDFNTFYGNGLSFNIDKVIVDGKDSIKDGDGYHGYTGDDYSGYYIGTIINFNTNNGQADFFDAIIAYYIGNKDYDVRELKVEDPLGTFGISTDVDTGISLTVTWQQDLKSGTWSLNNAYGFGFYAVKGGNDFALYFVDPARSSGIWTTRHLEAGNPNNPNHPTISHLSGAPTFVHAPEPSSLLLLGGGLLGLGYVMRRRGQ